MANAPATADDALIIEKPPGTHAANSGVKVPDAYASHDQDSGLQA